jgi:hypothetical protein
MAYAKAIRRADGMICFVDRTGKEHEIGPNTPGNRNLAIVKRRRANKAESVKDAYESCGMVKVRGALGGTYWE